MKNKLFLQLLLGFALLCTPAVALAQTGPVHRALTGGTIEPHATTSLYVAPPKGGMAILYRDGAAAGWWMQPGYVTVAPNRIYGIVATRGKTMLFGARLMLRPGLTEVVWARGDQPHIAHQPAYRLRAHRATAHRRSPARRRPSAHHRPPAQRRPATHRRPAAPGKRADSSSSRVRRAAAGNGVIGAARHRQLVRKLARQRSDSSRMKRAHSEAKRHRFTSAQAKGAVSKPTTRRYSQRAAKLLRRRTAKRATTSRSNR